ncbi:MAG: DNA repair protein RecO [Candidatus Woykebacteria bacterium RBG_13_40_15]|uniref:DNA repair protein RecO n=1 Tax=Candidatus Woykebacteria bacterium RBG_13_40_15 TaxID=1802593 RepID=A0A1G1W9E6_9BACT|nr:MAG: DNA repair protein RecO [Candidatus Woykebacteria bacterium RBG_13_40_15]
MSKTYSTEAIVLKRSNFGEADRIITFLARYKGKFSAIAKGVRKIASRRAPNLELLNHIKIYLANGKNLDVITEVQTLETFKQVKGDLSKVGFGFHLAELTNGFLADGQGGKRPFDLLLGSLRLLEREEREENFKKIARVFEIKFLDALGFKPQLFTCVRCNKQVDNSAFISPYIGGVVHKNCLGSPLFVKPVASESLNKLRAFQSSTWSQISKINITASINQELEGLSRFYLEYLLEKELKSVQFIKQAASFKTASGSD